jgi:hypothetical protein
MLISTDRLQTLTSRSLGRLVYTWYTTQVNFSRSSESEIEIYFKIL